MKCTISTSGIILLGIVAGLSGCGKSTDTTPAPVPAPAVVDAPKAPTPPATAPTTVTFAEVNAKIFSPLCLKCHDGTTANPRAGVTFNSYDEVKKFIGKVEAEALVAKTMPPRKPLSDDNQALLKKWIDDGMKE